MQTWHFASPSFTNGHKRVSPIPRVNAVADFRTLTKSNVVTKRKKQYAVVTSISNISNSMSNLINTIKKSIKNIYPTHTKSHCITTYTQDITPNAWQWYNHKTWQEFRPLISAQIDDMIHYQWRNTNKNPIIFRLTTGSWIGDTNGRNIYSLHAYLDETRTTIINIYRVNNNTKVMNKLKRSTPSSLLPPILPNYKKCNRKQSNENSPMDISQFKYVGTHNEKLVFGYIRMIEDEITLSRNISLSVYQICAIFQSGINIKLGNKIDACDRAGKWFLAEIKQHKRIGETVKFKLSKLTKEQRKNIRQLCKLEAVFIHYVGYESIFDEWIFIEEDYTICRCHGQCVPNIYKHTLAAPNTQSKLCNPN